MTAAERWARWSPPAGYERMDSLLEGFEVFGPAAEPEPSAGGPVAVRCPQCGASARFDVAKGRVGCPFCEWTAEGGPEVVGRRASVGEFTREALDRGAEGFGVDRRELGCGSCGAVIAVEQGALSATCPFCASSQVAIREHPTVQGLRPTALLPFAVRAEGCREVAAGWLGQGWFHPPDLADLSRINGFVGIYVPYWTFSAEVDSRWEAEVGYPRTETRTNSKGETETETVIDWRWESGSVTTSPRDLLIPGTARLSARLLSRLEGGLSLDRLVTYAPELLAGFQAQTYDVPLPEAWEAGRHRMREQAREACHRSIRSSHVRNFSMTADLDQESWRHVLLPFWVSAYRYDGRTWVVLIDGASGQVAGQKPIAWWKVWTAVAALMSPGVGLLLIGLPLLVIGVGMFALVASAVLSILGAVGSVLIYRHAVESEAL